MVEQKQIRILIVEDHNEIRSGLVYLISNTTDYWCKGFEDCESAIEYLNKEMVDVVLMDIVLPGMSGIECTKLLKNKYPNLQIIMCTIYEDDEKIFEAIKAGASGYLLKHEPADVLQDAIVNILESGGAPMSPAIARKALHLLSMAPVETRAPAGSTIPSAITEREKEILLHTINGLDAKRIAAVLDISVLTIRKHIANVYQKLHVNSKAQIINLAHKNNWV